MVTEEVETSRKRLKEAWAGWAGGGNRFGLEVSPCGLLHEAVANIDLGGGVGGSGE